MNDSRTAGRLELKRKVLKKKNHGYERQASCSALWRQKRWPPSEGSILWKCGLIWQESARTETTAGRAACSLKATAQKGASPGSAHSRCCKCGPWRMWFQASSQVGRKTWQPWPHAAGFTGIKVVRTDCIFKSWSLWRVGSCPQGTFLAGLAEWKVSLQLH